ncbi:hypothetical protein C0Q70_11509 [Pomacea canaliculata]|uniref:tRNA (uracil(54)-C(5))-methyltransferase n=2 Tax=Pomacea canaliculata TaxID=400727 RepID=A0A2T7P659_POMCA|nr:hypothetical protein C0Q70_11509 [Pomacea canaliculata]
MYNAAYKNNSLRRSKTLTAENQFERLAESATPLYRHPYEVQLEIKHQIMEKALRKVANIVHSKRKYCSEKIEKIIRDSDGLICPFLGIKPAPQTTNYRNKLQLLIYQGVDGEHLTIGLIVGRGENRVCVPTDHLKNIKSQHTKIIQSTRDFLQSPLSRCHGSWKGVLIRSNCWDQAMLVVQVGSKGLTEEVLEKVKCGLMSYYTPDFTADLGITSMYLQVTSENMGICKSQHHLQGDMHIYEQLLGHKFRISPNAFFQQNTPAAEVMYSLVHQIVASRQSKMLIDVGCGVGTIGILMSDVVDNILGIDMVDSAIADAIFNADLNDVKNASYVVGTARAVSKSLLVKDGVVHDDTVAVVNPCRNGLNKKAIMRLRGCDAIRQLIYISCKPHGNALVNFVDLIAPQSEELPGIPFTPVKAVAVDMFPQTVHSELIITFER